MGTCVRGLLWIGVGVASWGAIGQVSPHAGMLRYPDVSATHIVFSYANDLWVVAREGGEARPLASPAGQELFPRFSPDGMSVAFVGNYLGDRDVYVSSLSGGSPTRITHHPSTEVLCDWTAQDQLLWQTTGFAFRTRQTQLFVAGPKGGMPTMLPVPYGTNGSISPDGEWLAYTPHSTDTRTWKRYRGGMATDVWLFNLKDFSSKQITEWEGTDTQPMWSPRGDKVFYVSDQGDEHRLNVWSYDVASGERKQLTRFSEFDVKWPAMGPGATGRGEIVFQYGKDLYLYDINAGTSRAVAISIPGARPKLMTQQVDASKFMNRGAVSISPSAKRVAVEARGDIWSLPAEHGTPRNLTRTDGVAERDPAWSPDGKWISYWSDATGEYQLYITQSDGKGETKKLTDLGDRFRFGVSWSPDSKKLTYFDNSATLYLLDVESGEVKTIDKDPWSWDGTDGSVSWSHDSRWIAYDRASDESLISQVWVYSVEDDAKHALTAAYFNATSPAFDRKGEYLFYRSNQSYSPMYGELGTEFLYAGTEVLLAVPLKNDKASPWAPKSDEEAWDKDKKDDADEKKDGEDKKENGKKEAAPDDGVSGSWEGSVTGGEPLPPGGAPYTMIITMSADHKVSGSFVLAIGTASVDGTFDPASKAISAKLTIDSGGSATMTATISGETIKGTISAPEMNFEGSFEGKRTSKGGEKGAAGDKKDGDAKAKEKVEIDLEGFEARAMRLPIKPGNFGRLAVNDKNDLIYVRRSARGQEGPPSIKLFSLKDDKKEEKTVTGGAGGFDITPDGKKLLIMQGSTPAILDASSGATAKQVSNDPMLTSVDPRAEWKQVFTDAWRIQRDYFYEPTLHGVDWPKIRAQYEQMLVDASSREDLSYIIAEMISELNVGHAYYQGGDTESTPSVNVGLLGCDFALENGAYRITKIYRGADWDSDAVGPLSEPGVSASQGQYLLAVNGIAVDTSKDPWAAFVGLGGKTVTITLSENPERDDKAKDLVVTLLTNDGNLRYRDWIEARRRYVEERTGGKAGYIYVPSTGVDGQNDLVRQYYAQNGKPALIIDDRWNSGGQIPTRFIELLNRPATNYWALRHANDFPWPPDGHNGPKCMLVNGLAGSGGDAFPYYFRAAGLGKLIGMRTWGGLVGISGNPGLIDGQGITVPTFGFWELDGTWGVEGHGVDPDIVVVDDPALMAVGSPKRTGIGDPQLDAAIDHILKELETNPHRQPARPTSPNRSGMGLDPKDR